MHDGAIDPGKIRRILDLARAANNQQNPDQAIAFTDTLPLRGGEEGFEREWAEARLLLAESYTAKGSQLAETLFEEVFELLAQLPTPDATFELRAHEHYGDYLRRFAKFPSKARCQFEIAKTKAVDLRMEQDSARVQLKLETIELEMDKSPELENFATLKRIAKQWGHTWTEQLAAWLHYKGQAAQHEQGLKFARNKGQASEQYFKYLLDMVRMKT